MEYGLESSAEQSYSLKTTFFFLILPVTSSVMPFEYICCTCVSNARQSTINISDSLLDGFCLLDRDNSDLDPESVALIADDAARHVPRYPLMQKPSKITFAVVPVKADSGEAVPRIVVVDGTSRRVILRLFLAN
jgi:hypothetical protein